GIPVRARCGFAAYFDYSDHWICEYWDAAEERWVSVDPQLDEVQIKTYHLTFDPHDVPQEQFIIAGRAWQMHRFENVNARRFGFRHWRGSNFICGSIVRDLASLNKIELLPWDPPSASEPSKRVPFKDVQRLSNEELSYLDSLAALTLGDNDMFPQVRAAYESNPLLYRTIEALVDDEPDEAEAASDPVHNGLTDASFSNAYVDALLENITET